MDENMVKAIREIENVLIAHGLDFNVNVSMSDKHASILIMFPEEERDNKYVDDQKDDSGLLDE